MIAFYSSAGRLQPSSLRLPSSTRDRFERTGFKPPPPQADMMEFHTVIQQCNKFQGQIKDLWEVRVLDNKYPVGYMLDQLKEATAWDNTAFQIDEGKRIVHLNPKLGEGEDAVARCNNEFFRLAEQNVQNLNKCLEKWFQKQKDFHPIGGLAKHLDGIQVPAPLRGVIGQVTRGVHLNMYTYKKVDDSGDDKLHIWVSRRTPHVSYACKLDQVVAGGMNPEDKMDYMTTLVREAGEEAGLTIDKYTGDVTDKTGAVGKVQAGRVITFYDQKNAVAGPEDGHLEPGARMTYDLKVSPRYTPIPNDPEASAGFALKSVDEVKKDLLNAEWKPNSGLVALEFLLRIGAIDAKHEDITKLRDSLHRHLPIEPFANQSLRAPFK